MTRPQRVVPIRQLSETECGPACLAMLLTYFGRRTSLQHLRDQLNAGRDGLSVAELVKVAHAEGLLAYGRHVTVDDLATLKLPALLHWRERHFVLLESLTQTHAVIVDPAAGYRRVPLNAMEQDLSGTAVEFEIGQHFETRHVVDTNPLLRYLRWLFEPTVTRKYLLVAIVASLVLQLFGLLVPAATAILVDSTIAWSRRGLVPVVAAIVCMVISRIGVSVIRGHVIARLQRTIDGHVSLQFFDHLLRLPHQFFLQRTTGDLLQRVHGNTAIRELFTTQLIGASLDAPMALGFLAILFVMSPPLAVLALASAAAQIAVLVFAMRRQRELAVRVLAARADEQGRTIETLTGIAFVKAVAAESGMLARWRQAFQHHQQTTFETTLLATGIEALLGGLRLATPLTALVMGMAAVNSGSLSLGQMLAATTLVASFTQPVLALMQSAQQLQTAGAYIERVMDVLDSSPEVASDLPAHTQISAPVLPAKIRGHSGRRLACQALEFRFSSGSRPAFEDVGFEIEPGGSLGIIGPTGSGKSTLAKVLMGLWMPTGGELLHDGEPFQAHRQRFRSRTGAVLQEFDVFSGTIRENIALAIPDATLSAVKRAAMLACLDDDIAQMPMGYHTQIGDRGVALSGGQRQRLALARALLHEPDLLVLDEATSHLDERTEKTVNARVAELGCTRVIVSHRLNVVGDVDWLLVMKDGRVVASGTPRGVLGSHRETMEQSRLMEEHRKAG
ncbi:MAG TPA: peptidase domain-containing ABC transporter [Gemmatimonas aurantiaca]|uniref:Peptidase domain-containing ABC transporter n=2 Tax=Gemmatimonas aurantiaca TaxID=173480 RepID=A0A3D4VD09_9BACT|nr:peptidase domain-containing ABC transporter [Gemmatimonas aurantiaca]BAH40929.1 putative bacteriocin processing/transport ATP-binding protein [Gemmatimonas aurantiaca T-27]HCT58975.1 peptidase domain-containing ABC transporter [Gemmatimonas aurantiaca]